MSKLIAIDDGHGMETSGKRTPIFTDGTKSADTGKNFMHENEFNRAVANYLKADLEASGFRTIMVAPTDADTPLATRVATSDNANADFYISIHANANTGAWGSWGGAETLTYGSGESLRIGKIIHKHMMTGTPIRDRGVKDGSWLYVVKNTDAPAVLVECAFMDNLEEAKLLLSDAFRRETAREIAMALCEAYGYTYKSATASQPAVDPQPTLSQTVYRVRISWTDAKSQIGAYTNLDSAKDLANKSTGYKVFDPSGNVVYDPQPVKDDGVWYRVRKDWADAKSQIGAFHDVEGAKLLVGEHAGQGYKVFDESGNIVYQEQPKEEGIIHTVVAGETLWSLYEKYGVKVEDIKSKNNLTDNVISVGQKLIIKDSVVVEVPVAPVEAPKPVETVEPTPQPEPEPEAPVEAPKPPIEDHTGHHDIAGESTVTDVEKMVAFIKSENPDAQDIEEIVNCFIEVGNKYGLRGDIALCQSIVETHWFKFDLGTAVTPDQHNYCGMGVLSKGMKGNSFNTVKDGVTAQIQHLYAYATKLEIPSDDEMLDPRFQYVARGIAPHWEDLNMKWAMNDNYGQHIISLHERLEKFEYTPIVVEPVEQPVEETPVVIEQPEQSDEEKQLGFWKKVIDYLFEKISSFFGKK